MAWSCSLHWASVGCVWNTHWKDWKEFRTWIKWRTRWWIWDIWYRKRWVARGQNWCRHCGIPASCVLGEAPSTRIVSVDRWHKGKEGLGVGSGGIGVARLAALRLSYWDKAYKEGKSYCSDSLVVALAWRCLFISLVSARNIRDINGVTEWNTHFW